MTLSPTVTIPGVPVSFVPGARYILDHAGAEAARFGITPVALAATVSAQIGLAKIAADPAMLPVLVANVPKSAGLSAAAIYDPLSTRSTIVTPVPPKLVG